MTKIPDTDLLVEVYHTNEGYTMVPYRAMRVTHIPTQTVVMKVLSSRETYVDAKVFLLKKMKDRLAQLDETP